MEEENNEIGEEFNIDEIESNLVNNVVPEPEEWGELEIPIFKTEIYPRR